MCTLIAGIDVLGPGTLVLGANRDEAPERASAGPSILHDRPRVVGGRDLVAGGTWLAVREGRAVTALMNRRSRPDPQVALPTGGLRSRGLLCLEAAIAGPPRDAPHTIDPGTGERYPARLEAALALIQRGAYAACTLVGLDVEEPSWALFVESGRATEKQALGEGWHVVTHADVDDPNEPRAAWILRQIVRFAPRDAGEALDQVADLLRVHSEPDAGIPGVCLHRERFPTVSSTLLALGNVGSPIYRHAAGPPCTVPYLDMSGLLA